MSSIKNAGGVILSAGLSSRMGRFKPLLPMERKTVIEYVIENMRRSGIEKIAVVTGHNREFLAPVIEKCGAVELYNPDYAKEMFTSMKMGVKYFSAMQEIEGVFISPVDCPCVDSSDYMGLYSHVVGKNICACCSFLGRKGHPLWLSRSVFDRVINHAGEGGMKGALKDVDIERVDSDNEGVLLDMDTPEGYEEILKFVESGCHFPTAKEAACGKRLILVRHGRIVQHAGKIFLGQYDAPLSELGLEDADSAAFEMMKIAPNTNTVYSSPLVRAKTTAERVSDVIGASVTVNSDLSEIDLGTWDGCLISEIKEKYPRQFKERFDSPLKFVPPKGESMIHLRIRVLKALREICLNDVQCDIILVTHAGVINTIKCMLGYGDFNKIMTMEKPPYGSVTVLEVNDEDFKTQ